MISKGVHLRRNKAWFGFSNISVIYYSTDECQGVSVACQRISDSWWKCGYWETWVGSFLINRCEQLLLVVWHVIVEGYSTCCKGTVHVQFEDCWASKLRFNGKNGCVFDCNNLDYWFKCILEWKMAILFHSKIGFFLINAHERIETISWHHRYLTHFEPVGRLSSHALCSTKVQIYLSVKTN